MWFCFVIQVPGRLHPIEMEYIPVCGASQPSGKVSVTSQCLMYFSCMCACVHVCMCMLHGCMCGCVQIISVSSANFGMCTRTQGMVCKTILGPNVMQICVG